MTGKVIKYTQIIIVFISMAAGVFTYQHFLPEVFLLAEEESIAASRIQADPLGNYTGKAAGEGILHLTGRKELEQLNSSDYVTVTTGKIIPTNIYGLKPWVDPYHLTRIRTFDGRTGSMRRRASEVRKGSGVRAEAYQEYFLVRLPDASYCFAQINAAYGQQLKQEEITLPIGQKRVTSNEERKYLEAMGSSYGADASYLLYMVDDAWGEKNHFTFFLIRFGAAVIVFFLLAVGTTLILGKIFPCYISVL